MEVSLLPAESLLVAPDQRLRSCTQGGLCLSSPVCEGDKTRSCTQEASLIGTSKWQKLSLDEGVKEKSLSGTSKLLPSLGDEGNAKTVKLQSYDSSVTMKEALAVLKEAAIDVPTGPTEALKTDADMINSTEVTKEPLQPTVETISPEVSLVMTDAGRSVHAEEVAELRALLEEAIQDDGKDQEKSPKTLWLEEAVRKAAEPMPSVGIVGCNPSKAEGMEALIKSANVRAAPAPSEQLLHRLRTCTTPQNNRCTRRVTRGETPSTASTASADQTSPTSLGPYPAPWIAWHIATRKEATAARLSSLRLKVRRESPVPPSPPLPWMIRKSRHSHLRCKGPRALVRTCRRIF